MEQNWREIFSEYGWKINIDKLTLMEVSIEKAKLNGGSVSGFDWVPKERAEKIKDMAQNDTYQWMYLYRPCEERLRLTSQYMMSSETKEIKSAVFMYALLTQLNKERNNLWYETDSYKYIQNLRHEASLALPFGYRWHHNMRELLPDLGPISRVLRNIVIDGYGVLFDVAHMVLNHVVDNYTILHYYTIKKEEDPILVKIKNNNADGIDFLYYNAFEKDKEPYILLSCTKEQFQKMKSYPRTSYKFWKNIDNKKVYL